MHPEARRESVTLARAKLANLLVGWNTHVMWSSGFIVSYIFNVPPNASHYSRYRSREKVRKNLALKFCYSASDCQEPTVVRRRSSRGSSYIISRVLYFSILMRLYFGRLHYCNFVRGNWKERALNSRKRYKGAVSKILFSKKKSAEIQPFNKRTDDLQAVVRQEVG